jgi:hypothetical protein
MSCGTHLQRPVLSLNGDDLITDQLKDPVDNGFKALQNFFVGEGHVAFLDTSLWEISFNADVDSPFLAVVPEIGLDTILKVHDTLGVHLSGRSRTIGKFHLADLGSEDIAKVPVQGG